jgi:hypothetical protein
VRGTLPGGGSSIPTSSEPERRGGGCRAYNCGRSWLQRRLLMKRMHDRKEIQPPWSCNTLLRFWRSAGLNLQSPRRFPAGLAESQTGSVAVCPPPFGPAHPSQNIALLMSTPTETTSLLSPPSPALSTTSSTSSTTSKNRTLPNNILSISSLHIAEALSTSPSNSQTLRVFNLPNYVVGDDNEDGTDGYKASMINVIKFNSYIIHINYTSPIKNMLTWLLLLITFIETPSWCDHNCDTLFDETTINPYNIQQTIHTYPSFPFPYTNQLRPYLHTIEIAVIAFLMFDILLQVIYISNPSPLSLFRSTGYYTSSSSSSPSPSPKLRNYERNTSTSNTRRIGISKAPTLKTIYNTLATFHVLTLKLSIVTYLLPLSLSLTQSQQALIRPIRPIVRLLLFLSTHKTIVRELMLILSLLKRIFRILVLLFLTLLLYSYYGTVLFSNHSKDSKEGLLYFNNLGTSVWSLWILLTTANFPDIMLPSYMTNRYVIVFFGSFLVLNVFVVTNVLLASVYSCYVSEREHYMEVLKINRLSNIRESYNVLNFYNDDTVSKQTINDLVNVMNRYSKTIKHFKPIPQSKIQLILDILDKDNDGTISHREFETFVELIAVQFFDRNDINRYGRGFVRTFIPSLYDTAVWKRIETFVKSHAFDRTIYITLVVNTAVTLLSTHNELTGSNISGLHPLSSIYITLDVLFLAIYVLEIILKLGAVGHTKVFKKKRNVFDVIITLVSLTLTVAYYLPNTIILMPIKYISLAMLLRILRLIPIIFEFEGYKVIGDTLLEVIPKCKRLLIVLFVVLYTFSVVGLVLFGGVINLSQSSIYYKRLIASDETFFTEDWEVNNFNDMLSSYVLLFELLVINNWTVTYTGLSTACDNVLVVRLYFVVFHVIGVLVVNNLIVSFIVDVFNTTVNITPSITITSQQFYANHKNASHEDEEDVWIARVKDDNVLGINKEKVVEDVFGIRMSEDFEEEEGL